jgi:two-component system, NtrC family, sensor histidine kinase KinB
MSICFKTGYETRGGSMNQTKKLSLGLGFLFALIFILAGYCSYCVFNLGKDADNILNYNYNSMKYSRNMISALDDMQRSIGSIVINKDPVKGISDYNMRLFESGKNVFESNLKVESHNVTEIHEKEFVEKLKNDYEMYLRICLQIKSGGTANFTHFNDFLTANEKLKQSINSIYDINMQAVVRKTEITRHDSENFIISMGVIGFFCIILVFFYYSYFDIFPKD